MRQNRLGVFFRFVGHLFTELVALAKLFADDLDNVVGMAVGLGEDQGFGDFIRVGEDFGESVPEGSDTFRIWLGLTTF